MTNNCNSVNHTHLIFRSVKAATEAWIALDDESEEEEIDGEEEDIDVDQIGRLSRRFSSYFSQQIHVIMEGRRCSRSQSCELKGFILHLVSIFVPLLPSSRVDRT